jgi:arylsulfatase
MTNVVLLTVDALRADHLSCYGYHRDTTPVLDELARENARFTATYSTSSHTREAVPSILTGGYPSDVVGPDYRLAAPTVANLLGDSASTAGFHSNPYASRAYGFDDGFDTFDDDLYLGQHRLVALAQRAWDKLRNHHYARADDINERSLDWLDGVDGPFFLWNHYMDVHGPYEPPEPFRSQFYDGDVTDRTAQRLYSRAIKEPESITADERQTLLDLYDGELRYTDAKIGAFLDALAERGLREETLVLISSDHGDAFGEHGHYEHPRHVYDELVHVPLFVVGDAVPTRVVDAPTSTLDLVPTILRAFGVEGPDLPGVALQDVLDDPAAYAGRHVISEARGVDRPALRRYSVRSREETREYETDDGTPPTGGGPLVETLRQHVESRDGTKVNETTEAADGAVADRLEALGYKE